MTTVARAPSRSARAEVAECDRQAPVDESGGCPRLAAHGADTHAETTHSDKSPLSTSPPETVRPHPREVRNAVSRAALEYSAPDSAARRTTATRRWPMQPSTLPSLCPGEPDPTVRTPDTQKGESSARGERRLHVRRRPEQVGQCAAGQGSRPPNPGPRAGHRHRASWHCRALPATPQSSRCSAGPDTQGSRNDTRTAPTATTSRPSTSHSAPPSMTSCHRRPPPRRRHSHRDGNPARRGLPDVRIHDDSAARASTAEVGARSYTSGNHVVIGDGGTDRHTLAHELTHIIQQHQGPVAGTDNGAMPAGLRPLRPLRAGD